MDDVSFAPRSQISAWLRKGWRLVPGHDYDAGDWAIVMAKPVNPPPLTDDDIWQIATRFKRGKPPIMLYSNNKVRGALSSSETRRSHWANKTYCKMMRRQVSA